MFSTTPKPQRGDIFIDMGTLQKIIRRAPRLQLHSAPRDGINNDVVLLFYIYVTPPEFH